MRTIEREIASAVILSKDGKLFLGKKSEGNRGVYPDSWHIPGGGIEQSEDTLQALMREVEEETGIVIDTTTCEIIDDTRYGQSEKTLKDTGERVSVRMHFNDFKVTLTTNAAETHVSVSDEFDEYKWVELKDLSTIKLTPPSVELFKKLGWLK